MIKFQLILLTLLYCLSNKQLKAQESDYLSNLELAFQIASKSDKNVLLYFSGSDWCRQCLQLKNTVLSTPKFVDFSQRNLVIANADFPRKKDNQLNETTKSYFNDLAEKYNPAGIFPKVILFDRSGLILQDFSSVNQFQKYLEGVYK